MVTASKTALMLIDVQRGIDEAGHWGGNRNNPQAEQHIEALLHHWRIVELPVIIINIARFRRSHLSVLVTLEMP